MKFVFYIIKVDSKKDMNQVFHVLYYRTSLLPLRFSFKVQNYFNFRYIQSTVHLQ
jgi:hypothetical protein